MCIRMFNMEFDDEVLSRELENSSLFSQFVDMENENVPLFDIHEMTCVVTSTDENPPGSLTDDFNLVDRVTLTTPVVKQRKESRRKTQATGSTRKGTSTTKQRPTSRNAARERSRVKSLRSAFLELQNSLPSVPRNTKLSKLDVLVLATTYIAHLMKTLDESNCNNSNSNNIQNSSREDVNGTNTSNSSVNTLRSVFVESGSVVTTNNSGDISCTSELRHHRLHEKGYLHPVRKWPMRSRLYAGAFEEKPFSVLPQVSLEESDLPVSGFDTSFDDIFNFSSSTIASN